MGKMITGSIDLTKLLEQAKAQHSAFAKANNGHIYVSVLVWQNDEKDKYGNEFSVQLNAKKDAPETERKIYIGNMKFQEAGAGEPVKAEDIPEADSLPF